MLWYCARSKMAIHTRLVTGGVTKGGVYVSLTCAFVFGKA